MYRVFKNLLAGYLTNCRLVGLVAGLLHIGCDQLILLKICKLKEYNTKTKNIRAFFIICFFKVLD